MKQSFKFRMFSTTEVVFFGSGRSLAATRPGHTKRVRVRVVSTQRGRDGVAPG